MLKDVLTKSSYHVCNVWFNALEMFYQKGSALLLPALPDTDNNLWMAILTIHLTTPWQQIRFNNFQSAYYSGLWMVDGSRLVHCIELPPVVKETTKINRSENSRTDQKLCTVAWPMGVWRAVNLIWPKMPLNIMQLFKNIMRYVEKLSVAKNLLCGHQP